jgi:hypothetical protein
VKPSSKEKDIKMEFGTTYWVPSIAEMGAAGIQYTYLVQKRGDVVYVGYDTPHWVLSPVFIYCFVI